MTNSLKKKKNSKKNGSTLYLDTAVIRQRFFIVTENYILR